MIGGAILFLLTQLALLLFGLPVAFAPSMRNLGWPARLSAAFLLGAVLVTVEGTLLSLFGVKWGERSLALPLIVFSLLSSWRLAKRTSTTPPAERVPIGNGLMVACGVPLAATLTHLVLSVWYGLATSVEFIERWGVKAARYAQAKGVEAEFLRSPFAVHAGGGEPELFSTTLAWSVLLTGDDVWTFGTLTALLWFAVAVALVFAIFNRAMEREHALVAGTAWTVVAALALVHSKSAGAADAALLAFVTVALLALSVEAAGRPEMRLLAAIGMAGAVLTTNEGLLFVAVLFAGWLLKRFLTNRERMLHDAFWYAAWPLLAIGSWWAFRLTKGIVSPDATPEDFARTTTLAWRTEDFLLQFDAGSYGLSWLLPLLLLLAARRRWLDVLPALSLPLLMAFYVVVRAVGGWSPSGLAGTAQPALAALVSAALLVTIGNKASAAPGNRSAM